MAVYWVTLLYPDRSYEEHQRFLAAVSHSPSARLAQVGRHGAGLSLTLEVTTDLGPQMAAPMAREAALRFWPSFRPAVTLEAVEPPSQAS